MSNYLDKWNEFLEEDDVRDTYDDEVEKRNEKSREQGAKKMGLEERCQKGYKTHPTRKTKKMYGKTYRNCIKAEGEEKSRHAKELAKNRKKGYSPQAAVTAIPDHEQSDKAYYKSLNKKKGMSESELASRESLEEAMDPKLAEKIAQLEDRYLKARQRLRRSKSAPLSDPKARNEAAQILQQLTKLSKMGKYNMNNLRKKMKAAKNKNMSESLEELALQILDEKRKKKKKKKKKKKAKKDDRCTRIAKRKYDVWPSAYASGAVVQCRRGKIWKGLNEEEEPGLEIKIRKALRDEGGAAGMDALVKHTKASEKEIKDAIKDMDDVGQHEDGDYILADGEKVDILEEGWSDKYKRSIDCDNPKGFSQKAHCAGRKKRNEATLDEKKKKQVELEENLRKWFRRKGAPGKKGGWVDCNAPKYKDGKKVGYKSCGRSKGEKRSKYPACRPTAAACKSKGKGKKWGKKAAKKEALDINITKEQLDQIIFEKTREAYYETFIFPQLEGALFEDGTPVDIKWLHELLDEASCDCPHLVYEAEYRGRKVTLNKPTRGDVKKFKVYVKDPKTGNVKKVNFGHGGSSAKKKGEKTMKIRKSNPKARKSFRARHNCDNPGPKTKARYWSCKKW